MRLKAKNRDNLKGESAMMTYVICLALGLYFIYALRDALLILQDRRDMRRSGEKSPKAPASDYIIIQNKENCKRAG